MGAYVGRGGMSVWVGSGDTGADCSHIASKQTRLISLLLHCLFSNTIRDWQTR